MKYAVYQMNILPGDPEGNRTKVRHWLQETMKTRQPEVIVLPEMWTTAYTLPELDQYADHHAEPTTSFLQELAQDYQVHIIGGSVANQRDGTFYNTALIVNKNGELIYSYDKIHLVPMLNEPDYLSGGQEKAGLFEIEDVKMAVIICYDLRFPELTRQLALDGVQVLHVVAEWPRARRQHWRTLLMARAIENQMYIVASNRVGAYDGQTFAGTSLIVDPWGHVLQEGSETHEETLWEAIDVSQIPEIRERVPVFSSRVPELYEGPGAEDIDAYHAEDR